MSKKIFIIIIIIASISLAWYLLSPYFSPSRIVKNVLAIPPSTETFKMRCGPYAFTLYECELNVYREKSDTAEQAFERIKAIAHFYDGLDDWEFQGDQALVIERPTSCQDLAEKMWQKWNSFTTDGRSEFWAGCIFRTNFGIYGDKSFKVSIDEDSVYLHVVIF